MDVKGAMLATSLQLPAEKINFLQQPQINFLLKHSGDKNVVVGRPVNIKRTEQWVLPVAKNMYAKDGKYLGVI